MKTIYFKMNWLIPTLGIAVVAGTYLVATTYLNLERKTEAEQAFVVTVDRVYESQQLCAALKLIQEGEVKDAAQRLELLLCSNILQLDSERVSGDSQTRALVGLAFQKLAQGQAKTGSEAHAGTVLEGGDARTTAQKILALKVASARSTKAK